MTTTKKILLIDTSLHRKDATGITLSNLFNAWPKDKLYMIGSEEIVQLSQIEGYKNAYTLSSNDYYHKFPLGFLIRIFRLFVKKKIIEKSNHSLTNKSEKSNHSSYNNNFSFISLFAKIFQFFGLDHYYFRQILSRELNLWITKANPDFLYALLSTRHSILFAEEIQKKFNKPLIVHIMDDWPSTIGNKSIFNKYWNKKINQEFKDLINISYKRIAISKMMAEEYKIRFGGDWEYFHNPVDLKFWGNSPKTNYNYSATFEILYSGRLSTGITNTLQLIAQVIDDIELTESISIKLRIQSNCKPDWISKFKNTIYSDYIKYEDLPKLFSSVDLLLIPYDFHGASFEFIRLSMPTKATEYMASGTPIFIVAPENTAIIQYAREAEWAFIINTLDISILKKTIIDIVNCKNLRIKIGQHGLKIVAKYHEIEKVQEKFNKLFQKVLG